MNILLLLLLIIWNSATLIVTKTCDQLQVKDIYHNKYAKSHQISCLPGLSLAQCALECLLLALCESINHLDDRENNITMCEMNSHGVSSLVDMPDKPYVYVDIRVWQQDVAGTCASRPCSNAQRCIPTRPYRCMDIDCGTPPVLELPSDYKADVNMYPLPTSATLGSRADYKCRFPNRHVFMYGSIQECYRRYDRICNSDSSWTPNPIACV